MNRTTDVVVIGAGIAGAAAAAALAQRSHVVLVERETTPAQHASGRSASVLSETSGHPAVCVLARLSRPWFEGTHTGIDHPLLTPRGLVWTGQHGDEASLDELAEMGTAIRPSVRRLSSAQTAALLPEFRPHAIAAGAVHEPDAMSIDTAAAIESFLRQLRTRDGELLVSREAVTAEMTSDYWTIHAGDDTIEARLVVNAAGAWADDVAHRAGLDPLGIRSYRRTAAIAAVAHDVSQWPLVMDIAGRYYCEPEAGGLLVSPADETLVEPCDARPEELDVALALDQVNDATTLSLRSVRRAWAGLRCFAPDRVPVLGEDPDAPGFYWLAGQGGAGIKTAPALAELLARLVHRDGPHPGAAELGLDIASLSPTRLR